MLCVEWTYGEGKSSTKAQTFDLDPSKHSSLEIFSSTRKLDQVRDMYIKVQIVSLIFQFKQINFIICCENSRFKRTVMIAYMLVTRPPVSELAQNSNPDGVCFDVTEANG